MSKKTTRFYIPHPDDQNIKIAGDLEQVEPNLPTHGRKIALICHGVMGHKDYLYQKRLAKMLPIDSFRFDFRGNHETGGPWNIYDFASDVIDIRVVVAFLSKELGYTVDMVVAHSRGSISSFKWVASTPEGRNISYYVNCAGRFRMKRVLERLAIYGPSIEKQGFYEWKVRVAGQEKIGKIFEGDVERFASWDVSYLWDQFPQQIHVLTLQGLADEIVPPYDGVMYHRALSPRSPGTHTLHMVEGANHNFIGKHDEVNETIVEWFDKATEGTLQGGIWKTGVQTKL